MRLLQPIMPSVLTTGPLLMSSGSLNRDGAAQTLLHNGPDHDGPTIGQVGGIAAGVSATLLVIYGLSRLWRKPPALLPDTKPVTDSGRSAMQFAPLEESSDADISAPDYELPLFFRLERLLKKKAACEIFISQSSSRIPGAKMQEANPLLGKVSQIFGTPKGRNDKAGVMLRDTNGGTRNISLSHILSVRQPGDSLDSEFISDRIETPQFKDKTIYPSSLFGIRTRVLVDFSDKRLWTFINNKIKPIAAKMASDELNMWTAAIAAWQEIRDFVPQREQTALTDQDLYNLGDFLETGVLNERAMLLQVSLQYLGIQSEMETGSVGNDRFAWVKCMIWGHKMLLDPQRDQPLVAGVGTESDRDIARYQGQAARLRQGGVGASQPLQLNEDAEERMAELKIQPKHAVMALLASGIAEGATELTWRHVLQLRYEQAESYLRYPLKRPPKKGEAIVLESVSPFRKLAPEQLKQEVATAIEVYDTLEAEQQMDWWDYDIRHPDGGLPYGYLQKYYQQRMALAQEGTFPLGSAGAFRAMLGKMREAPQRKTIPFMRIQAKPEPEPAQEPVTVVEESGEAAPAVSGEPAVSEAPSVEAAATPQPASSAPGPGDLKGLLDVHLPHHSSLAPERRVGLIQEIMSLWESYPEMQGPDGSITPDLVTMGITLYGMRYPEINAAPSDL